LSCTQKMWDLVSAGQNRDDKLSLVLQFGLSCAALSASLHPAPQHPTCSDARPNLLCYSNAHLDSLLSGLTHGSSSSSFHIVMHGSSSGHRHLGTLALHLHPSVARTASPVAPLAARAPPRVALLLTTRRFGHCNCHFASS
jgi:hypothetical protein